MSIPDNQVYFQLDLLRKNGYVIFYVNGLFSERRMDGNEKMLAQSGKPMTEEKHAARPGRFLLLLSLSSRMVLKKSRLRESIGIGLAPCIIFSLIRTKERIWYP